MELVADDAEGRCQSKGSPTGLGQACNPTPCRPQSRTSVCLSTGKPGRRVAAGAIVIEEQPGTRKGKARGGLHRSDGNVPRFSFDICLSSNLVKGCICVSNAARPQRDGRNRVC